MMGLRILESLHKIWHLYISIFIRNEMNTKLTLTIDSKVIESAKKYSKEHGESISKIVEDYLRNFTPKQSRKKKSSIMELRGILGSAPADFDYRKERDEYLEEKYK